MRSTRPRSPQAATRPTRPRTFLPPSWAIRSPAQCHLRVRIATRVAIDERRKRRPTAELPELPADDGRPAYAELDHLTGDLPATERAAVVLRYGYDLDYADIATALGSSEDAARQATSSGVRRLRRRMT